MNTKTIRFSALLPSIMLVTALVIGASLLRSQEDSAPRDEYPLDVCVVTGAKLGSMGEVVKYDHNGRQIRFCCKGCIPTFKKDPARYLKKLDEARGPQQADSYPLDTCVVTGAKLGSMGDVVKYDHDGQEVRFCCKACIPVFRKDPARYLKKINDAVIRNQAAHYPLDTCPVTGGEIGSMGDPVDYLHEGRLVRFCCQGCIEPFKKRPQHFLDAMDKAIIQKELPGYPITTCIVDGRDLTVREVNPVNHVHNNHLVRLCSEDCLESFSGTPDAHWNKIAHHHGAAGHQGHDDCPVSGCTHGDHSKHGSGDHQERGSHNQGHGSHDGCVVPGCDHESHSDHDGMNHDDHGTRPEKEPRRSGRGCGGCGP